MSIAPALLQVSGGVFLAILFFAVLGGGLLIVAFFGARAASNPDYGGRGQGGNLFPARALCVVGLSFAAVGAFFVSMATDILGLILGMVGYFLGARVLGTLVVILSIATLLIGLLVGPLSIPGSYDQPTKGTSRPSSGE